MLDLLKQLYKSRTVIMNTLLIAVGVADYLSSNSVLAEYPEVAAVVVTVAGALNVVLRAMTTVPIWDKKSVLGNK